MNTKQNVQINQTSAQNLQLLRVFALILLIAYHVSLLFQSTERGPFEKVFYLLANTGWIGTDLFLALAGFLAFVSLSTHGSGFTWLIKKAVRILPSYWLFLLLYLALIPLVLNLAGFGTEMLSNYGRLDTARRIWPVLAAAGTNLVMAAGNPVGAALEPLLTLAVGIQWLLLIFALVRFCPAKALPFCIIGFEILGLLLRYLLRNEIVWLNYCLPFTRCDAFLLSFLAAWAVAHGYIGLLHRKIIKIVLTLSGSALLLLAVATHGLDIGLLLTSQVGYPLVGFCSALMVLLAATAETRKAENHFYVYPSRLGRFTYGAYFFKLPLTFLLLDVVGAPQGIGGLLAMMSAAVVLSFLLGGLWYLIVERPLISRAAVPAVTDGR